MRVVLDTNTAVSGLLWGGAPHAVIRLAQGAVVQLYASEPLLDERSDVLQLPSGCVIRDDIRRFGIVTVLLPIVFMHCCPAYGRHHADATAMEGSILERLCHTGLYVVPCCGEEPKCHGFE